MADLLQVGSDWLEDKRTEFMSRLVNYRRGNNGVDVQATVGKTVFDIQNEYGLIEKTETRDYLILADDLVLDGVAILPKRGDRVQEEAGDTIYIYEVMAPGNEPEWRYSDAYRKTLRIHTKMVAVAPKLPAN